MHLEVLLSFRFRSSLILIFYKLLVLCEQFLSRKEFKFLFDGSIMRVGCYTNIQINKNPGNAHKLCAPNVLDYSYGYCYWLHAIPHPSTPPLKLKEWAQRDICKCLIVNKMVFLKNKQVHVNSLQNL